MYGMFGQQHTPFHNFVKTNHLKYIYPVLTSLELSQLVRSNLTK